MQIDTLRKSALIVGATGQDGKYLAEFLKRKQYYVLGVGRGTKPQQLDDYTVIDLADSSDLLLDLVRSVRPLEIYYLAGHNFSSTDNHNNKDSLKPFVDVNLLGLDRILGVIKKDSLECRIFYASSCHIFGRPNVVPQTELTPYAPVSFYGITKSAATQLCRYYRDEHGLYVVAGILYNHESSLRNENFVTGLLARSAARAALGYGQPIFVRSLRAIVDWGAAQDYIRAMWVSLNQDAPRDYVIASGIGHTVEDFARIAFESVRLDWRDWVYTEEKQERINDQLPYIGDATVIRHCGWSPDISFEQMVTTMVLEYQANINATERLQ